MTTAEKVEALLQEIADLPDAAQAEVTDALIEMRADHLGLFPIDA